VEARVSTGRLREVVVLWLCLRPPHLARDALDIRGRDDLAIIQRRGNRAWIVDSTCGLTAGMDLGTAMALRPVTPVPRNAREESEALRQLATMSYALGSPVHVGHDEPLAFGGQPFGAVWVEIGASLQLFGGLDALLAQARSLLAQQPVAVELGVGPTLEGAALAAADGVAISTRDHLMRWLDRQPLSKLRIAPDLIATLAGCGLHRIGELYRLPSDGLRRRFGAPLADLLTRLVGSKPDVRKPFEIPERFRRRFELFGAVESTEGLLIPLRRLFVEFAQYLRVRDTGAQRFTVELLHENKGRSSLAIELVTPSRSANHFLLIARERLARTQFASGVTELVLRADRFVMPDRQQLEMFESAATSAREWATLVERLTARWGPNSVWSPALESDHRPERCWKRALAGERSVDMTFPARPHWLLVAPRAIAPPTSVNRAERLQGHWWPAQDRDYHIATARDGTQQWVYQDRTTQQWYLHGLWG
jgi:protein ImuB